MCGDQGSASLEGMMTDKGKGIMESASVEPKKNMAEIDFVQKVAEPVVVEEKTREKKKRSIRIIL